MLILINIIVITNIYCKIVISEKCSHLEAVFMPPLFIQIEITLHVVEETFKRNTGGLGYPPGVCVLEIRSRGSI